MLQGLKSEEHVLLVRKNATEARNLLLQHNAPLVISMAKTYDSTSGCSVVCCRGSSLRSMCCW